MVADIPLVRSVCPACGTITETDLRQLDHHPLATICVDYPARELRTLSAERAICTDHRGQVGARCFPILVRDMGHDAAIGKTLTRTIEN